jgi:hypothetical protein
MAKSLLRLVCAVVLVTVANIAMAQVEYQQKFSKSSFMLAIPEASQAPFDMFFSITSPTETDTEGVGWIGISCGGRMVGPPLVVAWPSGNTPVASVRWAE